MTKTFPLCGIYMIINNLNGDQYIGQSRNIVQRWWSHTAPNAREYNRLQTDIKRFGKSNFTLIILEECSVDELDEKEIFYISKFHPAYNVSTGGKGNRGYKPSEKQKEVYRQAALKQWREMDEATKKKILKNLTGQPIGHPVSAETRRKLSEKLKGRKASEEIKQRIREGKQRKKDSGWRQMNQGHRKTIFCTTTNQTFESVKSAGEYFGITPSAISGVLKGRCKTTHGLSFVYGGKDNGNN